jgi:hypothetical protein
MSPLVLRRFHVQVVGHNFPCPKHAPKLITCSVYRQVEPLRERAVRTSARLEQRDPPAGESGPRARSQADSPAGLSG